ncbi:MAG: hypothetical protein ACLUOS_15435 [Odoribacter splanchnicus]
MPYYEQAQMAEDQLVRQTVDGNMENPFGIYLYYSKLFDGKISTKENIGAEREYQKNFGPEAQQTPYIALMNAQLDRYADVLSVLSPRRLPAGIRWVIRSN